MDPVGILLETDVGVFLFCFCFLLCFQDSRRLCSDGHDHQPNFVFRCAFVVVAGGGGGGGGAMG